MKLADKNIIHVIHTVLSLKKILFKRLKVKKQSFKYFPSKRIRNILKTIFTDTIKNQHNYYT